MTLRLLRPPSDIQSDCSVWAPVLINAPTTINMMLDLCSADGTAPRWWSGCATPPPKRTPVPMIQYATYPPDQLPTAPPFVTQSPLTTLAPMARSSSDAHCDPIVCAMGTSHGSPVASSYPRVTYGVMERAAVFLPTCRAQNCASNECQATTDAVYASAFAMHP
jgi:hypothetical protein